MHEHRLPPTERALNVWASALHHAAHGGTGHPPLTEALCEPSKGEGGLRLAERSDLTYDASTGKYGALAKLKPDFGVLAAIESVERALHRMSAPEWFRRYLLFKYPTVGRFGPRTPTDDPEREFVDSRLMDAVLGGVWSPQVGRCATKTVRAVERAFKRALTDELKNQAASSRTPSARCDSPAPDGTV